VVQAPESCDDGNAIDADACTGSCQLARCGDGIRQLGEACDDGNSDSLDRCANDCTTTACSPSYHLESGVCTSDTRSCAVANGTGSQTYASGSWGSCGIVSCNTNYHVESGACLSNTRSCVAANAVAASESWTGIAYGTCTATACASGFAGFMVTMLRAVKIVFTGVNVSLGRWGATQRPVQSSSVPLSRSAAAT
jgi:cysteine-rich repeat protein